MRYNEVKILDYGYIRLIETWGCGDDGLDYWSTDNECGIIEAARQSTQGSFRGWEQDEKLLKHLYENKHATPFEFSGMVVEVQAPIFVFREWHRHRTQSYNEMSARYSPLPNNNYLPTVERCLIVSGTNKQAGAIKGSEVITHESALEWLTSLENVYDKCEEVYQDGLRRGIPKEVARICVPVGRYSRMRASTCLRNWLAFVTLRSSPHAQWEIQQFSNEIGRLISQQFPRTWALFNKEQTKEV